MASIDYKEVLETEFDTYDLGPTTIRHYLKALLGTLLIEGESFSGKRPFGNSGWEYDLAGALIKAGALIGKWNEEDGASEFSWKEYYSVLGNVVEAM